MLSQIYVRLLFFIFLYVFSVENAFCHTSNWPINSEISADKSVIFNVLKYGAKGDGTTNDADAFEKTWDVACKTEQGVMLVPSGFTFLLQPVNFDGSSCQPRTVLQVEGKIIAPMKLDWVKRDVQWILFKGATKGIIITGKGVIDGQGSSWWKSNDGSTSRPHAVRIASSSQVTVTGITIANSPKMHIFFEDNQNVQIFNFATSSPTDSPNTDGIHLSRTQHVDIHNCTLACGDDCVSIQNGTSNVEIYDVNCDPGHGFSIGGLGPKLEEARVSDITVHDSEVHNALTGVRIKTWPGGYGSVQNIVFSKITMSDVKTPIVIDQFYCGGPKVCPVPNKNAVAISNVTYMGITATYSSRPVSLACSEYIPCRKLMFSTVKITPTSERAMEGPVQPYCSYAYGKLLTDTTPSLKGCVLSEN